MHLKYIKIIILFVMFIPAMTFAKAEVGFFGAANTAFGSQNGVQYGFGYGGGFVVLVDVAKWLKLDARVEHQFWQTKDRTVLGFNLSGAQYHFVGGALHADFVWSKVVYTGLGAGFYYLFSDSIGGRSPTEFKLSVIPIGFRFNRFFVETRMFFKLDEIGTYFPVALQLGVIF